MEQGLNERSAPVICEPPFTPVLQGQLGLHTETALTASGTILTSILQKMRPTLPLTENQIYLVPGGGGRAGRALGRRLRG